MCKYRRYFGSFDKSKYITNSVNVYSVFNEHSFLGFINNDVLSQKKFISPLYKTMGRKEIDKKWRGKKQQRLQHICRHHLTFKELKEQEQEEHHYNDPQPSPSKNQAQHFYLEQKKYYSSLTHISIRRGKK